MEGARSVIGSEELIKRVRRKTAIDIFRAQAMVTATLQAMAKMVGTDAIAPISAQLPKELSVATRVATVPRVVPLPAFLDRLSAIAIVDSGGVRADVRAVLATLNETIEGGHLTEILSGLPPEYRELLDSTDAETSGSA